MQTDITTESTDAITNPANNFLKHGMGAAGQIAKKGGPTIQAESDAYVKARGNVKTGQCMYTGAGKLKSKYVIHTVGPIWNR